MFVLPVRPAIISSRLALYLFSTNTRNMYSWCSSNNLLLRPKMASRNSVFFSTETSQNYTLSTSQRRITFSWGQPQQTWFLSMKKSTKVNTKLVKIKLSLKSVQNLCKVSSVNILIFIQMKMLTLSAIHFLY